MFIPYKGLSFFYRRYYTKTLNKKEVQVVEGFTEVYSPLCLFRNMLNFEFIHFT